jgi:hypothetical protein
MLSLFEMMVYGSQKMNPNMRKEYFSSDLSYDTLFIGCQNGHLREPIDDQKNTIVTMFDGEKT